MTSPLQWHVPGRETVRDEVDRKDYLAATRAWTTSVMVPEMRRRVALLSHLRDDPVAQAKVVKHCKTDVVQWVDDWAWAYDPRLVEDGLPAWIPIIMFPRQVDLLRYIDACLEVGDNGLTEKSRDVGASTIYCLHAVHRWQNRRGFKAAFGSRILDLADKLGDSDSLLEKCRNAILGQPRWFWPVDHKEPERSFDPTRDLGHKLLLNRVLNCTIKAEGGDEIGRGGRQTYRVLDEYAKIPRPEKINGATATGQRSLFKVSTPGLPGDAFHKERISGRSRVFTIRWQDDPRKDQAWRDEQDNKITPMTARRELDLDYTAGALDVAIPAEWVRVAVEDARLMPRGLGRRRAGLDVAEKGDAESVWTGREGPSLLELAAWQGKNTTQTALEAARRSRAFAAEALIYDAVGVGAGVSGTLESASEPWPFEVVGIFSGTEPWAGSVDDAPDIPNHVRFLNWRACATWSLRRRFEKRYETVLGIRVWPVEEQIFIPDDPELIAQMSLLKWEHTTDGKIKLESKKTAAVRLSADGQGTTLMLDRFDSAVLCYSEPSIGLLI